MAKRTYTKSSKEARLQALNARIKRLEAAHEKRLSAIGQLREKAQKLQNRIGNVQPVVPPEEPKVG